MRREGHNAQKRILTLRQRIQRGDLYLSLKACDKARGVVSLWISRNSEHALAVRPIILCDRTQTVRSQRRHRFPRRVALERMAGERLASGTLPCNGAVVENERTIQSQLFRHSTRAYPT